MTKELSAPSRSHSQSSTSIFPSPSEYPFTKNQRLLNAADFSRVFADAPIRASHPQFLILAKYAEGKQARIGLVIAKKHVRRAVDRNRIKRVARECFRLQQHKLPPIDAIVLARRGAHTIPSSELSTIFNGLWKRIRKRTESGA